jgi:hypothetical protein
LNNLPIVYSHLTFFSTIPDYYIFIFVLKNFLKFQNIKIIQINPKNHFIMKRKNYLFSFAWLRNISLLISALIVSLAVNAQDITTGLIMHYSFDNVTDTTVVPDLSGNNLNGAVNGTARLVEGYSGKGMIMTPKTDFIKLPADINVNLKSFTFATWVKFSALKKNNRFFDLGSGIDATNNYLVFMPSADNDNANMRLRYRPVSGTAMNVDGTTKCPVGTWAHVALTLNWDDATSLATVKIYLNGAVVGSNTSYIANPSMVGATTDNYIGVSRWNQDTNGFNGIIDDVRFYNRALTATDILSMTGLAELNKQYDALTLGDISAGIDKNLTLPLTLGTQGVTVKWTSSKPAVIDSVGNVTRPAKYDTNVKLTAKLTLLVNGKENSMEKVFNVKVLGIAGTPEHVAQWKFGNDEISVSNDTVYVNDITESTFKGKLLNQASVRTIGNTTQFNVLDLGSNNGYFDMGKSIGEAIYALNDHTIMGFYRVDETYTNLAAGGNYYWNFSNSDKVGTDVNGFMYGRLNAHAAGLSAYGSPSTATNPNVPATQGSWHHFAYTLKGTTGTVYVDGVKLTENTAMLIPSATLPKDGFSGTLYNWLGRSGWAADAYLKQTLLYDFNIYSVALTADNLNLDMEIPATLDLLNNAYTENPDFKSPALQTEYDNLTLGDLSNVTSKITLPVQGTLDPSIKIDWKSSCDSVISKTGDVKLPDYFSYQVTLTATLKSGIQMLKKTFTATVPFKPGTQFTGDLIAKFDFSKVEGRNVSDVAEKQFKGTVMNDARIRTIGSTGTGYFNTLDLGDSIGYFDMGTEIGKTLYHLNDYTMSAFFRIDTAYHALNTNGNFLWTFSNTSDAMAVQTGYIIGSLKNLSQSITPGYYTAASGNQAVAFNQLAMQGNWHHLCYTQGGTVGTIYVDGMPVVFGDITALPSAALSKEGKLGTIFNWLGRSNYVSDVYLRNTLVYDFRLYKRALTDIEILATELNVGESIEKLEAAYAANPDVIQGVKPVIESPYKIVAQNGLIQIKGLSGTENVTLFDITGRKINNISKSEFKVNSGVYVIRINNYASKIMVK